MSTVIENVGAVAVWGGRAWEIIPADERGRIELRSQTEWTPPMVGGRYWTRGRAAIVVGPAGWSYYEAICGRWTQQTDWARGYVARVQGIVAQEPWRLLALPAPQDS